MKKFIKYLNNKKFYIPEIEYDLPMNKDIEDEEIEKYKLKNKINKLEKEKNNLNKQLEDLKRYCNYKFDLNNDKDLIIDVIEKHSMSEINNKITFSNLTIITNSFIGCYFVYDNITKGCLKIENEKIDKLQSLPYGKL